MPGPNLPMPDVGGAMTSIAKDVQQQVKQMPGEMGDAVVQQVSGKDVSVPKDVEQGNSTGSRSATSNSDGGVQDSEEKNREKDVRLKQIRSRLKQMDAEIEAKRNERERRWQEQQQQEVEEKEQKKQFEIQQKKKRWNVVDQLRQEFGGSGEVSGVRKH